MLKFAAAVSSAAGLVILVVAGGTLEVLRRLRGTMEADAYGTETARFWDIIRHEDWDDIDDDVL